MPVKTEPRAFTAAPLTSLLPSCSLLSSPTVFPSALHRSITSLSPNPTLSLPSARLPAHLVTISPSALGALSSLGTLGAFKTNKPPQVFTGLRFVLDLPPDAPLKEKTLWRRRLLDNGAQIAYSMSKRVCSTFYCSIAIIALSAHYCIDDMMTNS